MMFEKWEIILLMGLLIAGGLLAYGAWG